MHFIPLLLLANIALAIPTRSGPGPSKRSNNTNWDPAYPEYGDGYDDEYGDDYNYGDEGQDEGEGEGEGEGEDGYEEENYSHDDGDEDEDIDDLLPEIVDANPRSGDKDLIQSLLLSATQSDRAALLTEPGDWIFDFNEDAAPEDSIASGDGGSAVAANAKTFPALIGNGAGMTLGFLGPCGMNTPHVHSRATELNVVVKGRLVTNFILENGVEPVENLLSEFQMAVFPQGSIHQEFNPDCEDAVFVAGFNSEDPGVSQVAQNFFGLRDDVVIATLGLNWVQTLNGKDIESFRDMIPENVALGIEACLDKCGIGEEEKKEKRDLLKK